MAHTMPSSIIKLIIRRWGLGRMFISQIYRKVLKARTAARGEENQVMMDPGYHQAWFGDSLFRSHY